MTYLIILFLLLIIASLASAGFFMLRKPSNDVPTKSNPSRSMVRALTFRIGLSVALFIFVLIAWQLGFIQPTGLPLHTQ
jgi:uncharacterized metal-binding protein